MRETWPSMRIHSLPINLEFSAPQCFLPVCLMQHGWIKKSQISSSFQGFLFQFTFLALQSCKKSSSFTLCCSEDGCPKSIPRFFSQTVAHKNIKAQTALPPSCSNRPPVLVYGQRCLRCIKVSKLQQVYTWEFPWLEWYWSSISDPIIEHWIRGNWSFPSGRQAPLGIFSESGILHPKERQPNRV